MLYVLAACVAFFILKKLYKIAATLGTVILMFKLFHLVTGQNLLGLVINSVLGN